VSTSLRGKRVDERGVRMFVLHDTKFRQSNALRISRGVIRRGELGERASDM
jgi:hypothetical protein